MLSFENPNSTMYNVFLFIVAALTVALIYRAVMYFMPKKMMTGTDLQSLSLPSYTESQKVSDSDFNYLHGTTVKVDGLSPDPSNEVQKYKKSVDVTGRAFWEPLPMTSVNDYLTPEEYDGILNRHILRNMTPNLKHLTMPKFIRNADNFWGTYWPNETGGPLDNGRCVDPSDLDGKQGLFQHVPF